MSYTMATLTETVSSPRLPPCRRSQRPFFFFCKLWLLEAPNGSDSINNAEKRKTPQQKRQRESNGTNTRSHERYQHGRGVHGRPQGALELTWCRPVGTGNSWKQWSKTTRSKENWAKLQLMERTEAEQDEIRNACVEQGVEEWEVCDEAEALGASISRSSPPGQRNTSNGHDPMAQQRDLHRSGPNSVQLNGCIMDRSQQLYERAHGLHGCEGVGK